MRFVFQMNAGNWVMNQVEYDGTTLDAVGEVPSGNLISSPPFLPSSSCPYFSRMFSCIGMIFQPLTFSAPFGFSFACAGTFVFRKEAISLTLRKIQVQPMLQGVTKFSKAYDCVGIMTAGIASGIFVTFILGLALSIAILAILDIKAPNKFENRNSKQLTFTVQE